MGTCFWEAPLWKKLLGIFGDVRDIRQESACSMGTVVKAFGHPDGVALRAAESLEVVKVFCWPSSSVLMSALCVRNKALKWP